MLQLGQKVTILVLEDPLYEELVREDVLLQKRRDPYIIIV
jgi:hypothetical protein